MLQNPNWIGTSAALAVAVATPALAQSTIVLPQPGGQGYIVVPPQGFSSTVMPLPGGQGWLVVPAPGQGPSTTVLPLPGSAPQPFPPLTTGQPQP